MFMGLANNGDPYVERMFTEKIKELDCICSGSLALKPPQILLNLPVSPPFGLISGEYSFKGRSFSHISRLRTELIFEGGWCPVQSGWNLPSAQLIVATYRSARASTQKRPLSRTRGGFRYNFRMEIWAARSFEGPKT